MQYLHQNPIPYINLYSPQMPVSSVTAGSVNPAAIYVVRTIYIPTNNVVPMQYLPQNLIHIHKIIFLLQLYMYVYASVTSHHIATPYMSFVQFTTPTNNVVSIKYLTKKNRIHIHKIILLLQLYIHMYASVTAGSVNPAAIYVVRTIYTPTNNVV